MPLLIDTFAENTNFSRKLNLLHKCVTSLANSLKVFKLNFSSKKIQLNFPGGGCFITFCWPDTNNAWQFFSKPFFHNYVLQVQSVFLKVHVFLLLYKKYTKMYCKPISDQLSIAWHLYVYLHNYVRT